MKVLILDREAEFYARNLSELARGAEYIAAHTEAEALERGAQAEVLIALAPLVSPELLTGLPDLVWIQALTTGVDNLMGLNGPALTNCNGIHGPQMSELAVLLMLASARQFPRVLGNQTAATWDRWPQPLLAGKTVCLVGVGAISEHLAKLLDAFGMQVTGVTGRAEVDGFARTYPRAQLLAALAEADFAVVLTPYTADTHHLINAEAIAAMKPTAHLINLSRGGCVDETAVAEALDKGLIAGAALDVFAQEPLPESSPLWSQKKLIITPHLGGLSDIYHEQALPVVVANMRSYLDGGLGALEGRLDQ